MEKPGHALDQLLKKGERNWYKEAKEWGANCPKCQYTGIVSEFIQDPYEKLSYYGFNLSKCPNCGESLKFDFEKKRINEINKGRKPPPVMFGTGRLIDLLILACLFYLFIAGKLFWQPMVYLVLVIAGYAWELYLKKDDEIWYVTDVLFEDITDRIARIGLPLSITKGVILIISAYILIFK